MPRRWWVSSAALRGCAEWRLNVNWKDKVLVGVVVVVCVGVVAAVLAPKVVAGAAGGAAIGAGAVATKYAMAWLPLAFA